MAIQGYLFYFNQQFLLDAGITIEGAPNLNIIYTTAGRLVAMTAAFVLVLYTQDPKQVLVVLFLSIFKDGQQTLIDPLFPYANADPLVDLGTHSVVVALEIWAFIVVYRITRKENKDNEPASHTC